MIKRDIWCITTVLMKILKKKKKKKWIKKKKQHIFLVCTAWFVCTYGNPEIA